MFVVAEVLDISAKVMPSLQLVGWFFVFLHFEFGDLVFGADHVFGCPCPRSRRSHLLVMMFGLYFEGRAN